MDVRQIASAVAKRAQDNTLGTLSSVEALAASLAATTARDVESMAGMLQSSYAARLVTKNATRIAMSLEEWVSLFTGESFRQHRDVDSVCADSGFEETVTKIEKALKCSLDETRATEAWKRKSTRVAVFFALHMEDVESAVSASLGGLVKSDLRRLEDLRNEVEDEGSNELLLSTVILALARSAFA